MFNSILLSANTVKISDVLTWIVVFLLGTGFLLWIVSYFVASFMVYDKTLRRKNKEQWSRSPSSLDGEYLKMDNEGLKWYEANKQYKNDVHIINGGLNLYGEYYDFGSDKCVIFLSGRTESLRYGYYFAKPYSDFGINVLLIDPRAHGLSDGEFNTVGFEESKDAIAWAKYLHNNHNIKSIVFHGICIGAAGAVLALTSDDCPDYIEGMTSEGMFANFGESMKNHLIERKKPTFILYDLIDMWMKHYTGHTMNIGPIDYIEKMSKPLLMIHSREDIYSVPENAIKLYELSPSKNKRLVWYDHGRHSMLRITDTEKYDNAVKEFLSSCYSEVCVKE